MFRTRLQEAGVETVVLALPRLVRRGTRYRAGMGQTAGMLAAGFPVALRLESLVRTTRSDLVHTNGAKAHLLGGFAGRLAGRPVVWHVRDFPPQGGAGRIFRHALRRFPARIIVNSAAVADSLRALGAAPSRVVVVHNPVDLDRFNPAVNRMAARASLGLSADGPVVGLVAHLTPWKGHGRFLHIARQVLEALPQAHFVIAGGAIYETDGHDGYLESLKKEALSLGLENRLTFIGNSDDVPSVIAALDVLVHCPTAPEPFGRVVAEAMASGRSVVAARCGGIPEFVPADCGFLIDGDDVDGFARAVIALAGDSARADAMGRAGRVEAERHFGVRQHAERVFGVYQELREVEAIA